MAGSVHYFADRAEAGKRLAEALAGYARRTDVLVLALPRGGVPVAYEVAQTLAVQMDLWLVRKLGVPGQEELAMGAIAGNDTRVLNRDIISVLNIDRTTIEAVIVKEQAELERRNLLYRQGRPSPNIEGKTIIIIDDGLATGATMRAAIASLRHAGAAKIIAAVPVGAAATCGKIEQEADELVCLYTPEPFYGVGQWYSDFSQTPDESVLALLESAAKSQGSAPIKPAKTL
ncbi:Predicted phosphoribosyltransferase [Nitrosospira sp. Nsp11]|uniref:phosphoribosyltransferase n=1 Tax=Nitrosospira sp. Nsp11 TaxID=1855338 RepID=UPI000918872E|nr:phosphoribosyltransferase [Nitrosospira sp. Nsp11]SHL34000.1 Predicted phosphoribosyltransferase [Nitrosospira sp. Nsp11]